MRGKVVIDCGNPYPRRDGPMAEDALAKGTGVASAEFLPGVRLVRAFNAISYRSVERRLTVRASRSGFRSPATTRMRSESCRISWWTPASIRSWSGRSLGRENSIRVQLCT